MARRKHQPTEPANDAGSPVFESEADAERYLVDCVQKLQDARPLGERGKSVSRSAIERQIAIEHAHIGPDSLDRYLVNLLSDGRLGVTAGRWWVRRKATAVLVLGLLVLLTGCGSSFRYEAAGMDGVAGGATLASAGAPAIGTAGAAGETMAAPGGTAGAAGETMAAPGGTAGAAGETMAAPGGTAGATLGSAGAPSLGTGGATLGSAGAPSLGTGGATLASAGAAAAGVLVTAGSPGLPTGGTAGSGVRWPACLAEGCGASCRTLVGQGWCDVMARCLTDNGCIASDQPNCTGCSALPDGIDCECSP